MDSDKDDSEAESDYDNDKFSDVDFKQVGKFIQYEISAIVPNRRNFNGGLEWMCNFLAGIWLKSEFQHWDYALPLHVLCTSRNGGETANICTLIY